MNPLNPAMNDYEFDSLLSAAKDEHPLPPSFRLTVWHRIESTSNTFVMDFAPRSFRWSMALGVAATVAMGLWLGAVSIPDAKDPQLAYAESISPFHHARGK